MVKLMLVSLLLLQVVIIRISATTHFVVTDNGRIQTMPESVFQLRRSYDLVSFLKQGERRDSMNKLFESMKIRKALIDKQFVGLKSVSDVENGLHLSDVDCILKGLYNVDFNFHDSIIQEGIFRDGIRPDDIIIDIDSHNKILVEPDCRNTFPLDFSMLTFEHFEAMKSRKNLVQHPEKNLMNMIPSKTDIDLVGNGIANGLSHNKSSWLHLNLASIYWRIKGNAYNAIECGRRAIVTAPPKFRDIPLLTTGGILHAANYSNEAAIVVRTAIEYSPNESSHHLALGNIYAFLGEYNKSVEYYDNSLKISPTLDVARSAKHNILCNLKLENSLNALHQQLLNILIELRAYHNEQTELLSFQESILWEDIKQMPFLSSPEGIFEHHNYNPLNHGQTCMQKINGKQSIVSCDVMSERHMLAQKLQLDFGVSLQVLKNLENQAKEIRESITKSKFTSDYLYRVTQMPDYSKISSVFLEPTGRPKYYNYEVKESNFDFEKPGWPSDTFCDALVANIADLNQYISVYLPPENKGYVTYLFLNELIGIEPNKEHPLPWYPPTCQKPKSFNSKIISPELLQVTTGNHVAEVSLSNHLASLVENAELAEIGQRILTATNSKVAAPWVLSMLASLYWRVVGKPRNALDCLQLALDTVPDKFRDVPLVSIASISYKFDLIDNALSVVEEAYDVNSIEPATNFLFGTLLYPKRNYSGSIYHLKQTLRVEPNALEGEALHRLQTIACALQYNQETRNISIEISDTTTWCIGITNLPEKFKNHDYRVDESIMCDSDGNNCKHVQCFAMNTDSGILAGV